MLSRVNQARLIASMRCQRMDKKRKEKIYMRSRLVSKRAHELIDAPLGSHAASLGNQPRHFDLDFESGAAKQTS